MLNNVNLQISSKDDRLVFSVFLNPNLYPLKLNFFKYHGTGNDFILIDNRENIFMPENKLIAWLCHRRFGIGADGLILLNKAEGYGFGMQYFNSDGKESTMCGNGGRCIIAFADFLSLKGEKRRFLGNDGEHTGTVLSKNNNHYMIRLSMQDVPVYQVNNGDYILHTGSPHLVRFVDDIMSINVTAEGRNIRNLSEFQPNGVNVNFVCQEGERIIVRTYERGVEDETLSCGTGVTASALAFSVKKNIDGGIIQVITRGGALYVHFRKQDEGFAGIYLEGPAIKVFEGSIDINDLINLPADLLI